MDLPNSYCNVRFGLVGNKVWSKLRVICLVDGRRMVKRPAYQSEIGTLRAQVKREMVQLEGCFPHQREILRVASLYHW